MRVLLQLMRLLRLNIAVPKWQEETAADKYKKYARDAQSHGRASSVDRKEDLHRAKSDGWQDKPTSPKSPKMSHTRHPASIQPSFLTTT